MGKFERLASIIVTLPLLACCGQGNTCAEMDLDGDGVTETVRREGEWTVGVYRMAEGRPGNLQRVGTMVGNGEFFMTSDRRLVCLCGSQGDADIAVMRGDSLEHIDDCIDKALFGSKAFRDLEYDYDDDSEDCRSLPPLLLTEKYIICNRETIEGDHVLKIDLDNDGEQEQLYLGNPGWGAVCYDMARVHTRTQAYPFIPFMEDDTLAFCRSDLEAEKCACFRDCVQLSAVDVDSDGRYEVVVSAGTPQSNSTYLFSFDRERGLRLLGHSYSYGAVGEDEIPGAGALTGLR